MDPDATWPAPSTPRVEVIMVGRRSSFQWTERWLRPVRLRFWIAYWNQGPGAAMLSAGREWPLTGSQLLLLPPETEFQRRCTAPIDHWWCHFLVHGAGLAPSGPQSLKVDASRRRLLQALWHDLDGEPHPAAGARLGAFLTGCLAGLPWTTPPSIGDPRIDRLAGSLEKAGWPALDNQALAARVGLHPKALCRRFLQVTGKSPQEWLRERRIDRAAELLASGASVVEAAAATGFADRYHFSRVFHRCRGTGPATYRRLTQE